MIITHLRLISVVKIVCIILLLKIILLYRECLRFTFAKTILNNVLLFSGSPSPSVTWWRDSLLLDDTYYITTQGSVRNEITLLRLRRIDLMAVITCQASNNNMTTPTASYVTLDLNCKYFLYIFIPVRCIAINKTSHKKY